MVAYASRHILPMPTPESAQELCFVVPPSNLPIAVTMRRFPSGQSPRGTSWQFVTKVDGGEIWIQARGVDAPATLDASRLLAGRTPSL